MQRFRTVACLAVLIGCESSKDFGGKAGPKEQDESTDTDTSDDGTAPAPEPVTGSFLTCDYATDDGNPSAGDNSPVGCTARVNDRKIPQEGHSFTLRLLGQDGADLQMPTIPAAANSAWHVLGSFPNARANDSNFEMSVDDEVLKLSARKIGAYQGLGRTVALQEPVTSDLPAPPTLAPGDTSLSEIPVDAVWRGGNLGWIMGSVAIDDFCSSDGVQAEVTGESAVALDMFGMDSTLGVIQKVTKTAPSDSDCFDPFSTMLSFANELAFAHINSDQSCLFLKIGTDLQIVDLRKSGRDAFKLNAVRRLAWEHRCH